MRQLIMAKADAIATTTTNISIQYEKKKKSLIPRIFSKRNGRESSDDLTKSDHINAADFDLDTKIASIGREFDQGPFYSSERDLGKNAQSLSLPYFDQRPMAPSTETEELRIFAATWNVGGKTPNSDLNLENFLQVERSLDIYVIGFQEIVPLSAGNVLVIEDNEPAAKWLALINQALNEQKNDKEEDLGNNSSIKEYKSISASRHFFQKPSLKIPSRTFRADSRLLKSCNCPEKEFSPRERPRRVRKIGDSDGFLSPRYGSCVDEFYALANISPFEKINNNNNNNNNHHYNIKPSPPKTKSYRLVASKQMVGIFLSIWVRSDLIPHVGHLRVSSVGRGIMGRLGNKGCIAISMSLKQTSLCFICSHLASGEKEGDELKRNADVTEILKSTQFPKICKNFIRLDPEKITEHDRVIWLGDLNYRVGLSYEEAKTLLEANEWESLLDKDQLNIERKENRVFNGFQEGNILFAPTYKYSNNSDSYAGETVKSKKKRRTPAWCDRILWRGNGIRQESYIRGESRLSDHRPVCSVFTIEIEVNSTNSIRENRFRKGFSFVPHRLNYDSDCIPQRHSFYD